MNRRTLLVALGTIGITVSGSAAGQSDEDEENCESVEVVVGEDADGEITEEVPAGWQEHVERTEEARDEIEEEYGDESWFESASIREGDGEICDRSRIAISVNVSDTEKAREEIEERENVQILIDDGDQQDRPEALEDGSGAEENDSDTEANESETEEMARFGIIAALGGVSGAVYLLVRRLGGKE